VVPVDEVFDAARPVGALVEVVQLAAADVVTLRAVLWDPVPWASVAATVKEYVVDAVRPVTEKLVDVDVPIEVPPL
jgi:hypothetical protein